MESNGGWTFNRKVTGNIPIEVKGEDSDLFPTSDIETAIQTSGIESSYGGCGPLAMIGVLDYFSRYMNYTSIMNNPTESFDRTRLAYDVFKTTKTYQTSFSDKNQSISLFSDGGKSTTTFPGDYVSAFNKLMTDNYHLDKQIVAHSQGWFGISLSKKTRKIKECIDLGLPVTVYTHNAGDGDFGDHYCNIYEYQDWQGLDRNGNIINNVIFKVKANWGNGQAYDYIMDAQILDRNFTGVIYYTVADKNQIIRPSDFAKDFVNANGQGQYFFYEKTADITTSDGFVFGTRRLRCGYIENEYVVLSANRSGAGRAFLELNFDLDVKAVNMDIALWKDLDAIGSKDSIKMSYKDINGNWHELREFYTYELSSLREYPSNYYIEFPEITRGIKIEVTVTDPDGDRNKGRVVIGDMNLFYSK